MKATLFKKAVDPFIYLFWRTQIKVLRACPPLCCVVSKFSLAAANSPAVWTKTLLRMGARAPGAVFTHWRNKREKRVVLSRISLVVTTRCTLRCDKCLGHIPDLKSPRDIPLSGLLEDLQALFACIDYVYAIIISGGETFLYPDLDQVIRACAASGKAGDISVATNGTVIPDAKTLAALREADVTVKISRYDQALQPDAEKLKQILKENGIRCTHESGTSWRAMGGLGQLQAGSVKRRFSVCVQQLCMPYMNGKLYLCGESAVLFDEGLLVDCEADFIDVRAARPAGFAGQLEKLLKRRAVSACSYCLGNTYQTPKIPVAEQRGARDTQAK